MTAAVHDVRDPLLFEDKAFDAVYSPHVLHHGVTEDDILKMLAECRLVLRPDGLNLHSAATITTPTTVGSL